MKARFLAQQIAYGSRHDVFAGTPPLAVVRALLASTASRGTIENTGTLACSISQQHSCTLRLMSFPCSFRPGTDFISGAHCTIP